MPSLPNEMGKQGLY